MPKWRYITPRLNVESHIPIFISTGCRQYPSADFPLNQKRQIKSCRGGTKRDVSLMAFPSSQYYDSGEGHSVQGMRWKVICFTCKRSEQF
ncbi:unnamed protein product [Larinioides sclopetarius]|uniref:Uncharacterized protein n=1 Tax=Larinioides sclopetarius TaxID=280406 RepID=A0AAV1ZC31_9ARAC